MKTHLLSLLFLVCLSSFSQNTRIWGTYYGSNAADEGYDIAVDDSGFVYMTGKTASDTNIAAGGFQDTMGGGTYDAFLVKFDSNGNRIWATYYGGSGTDEGISITVDLAGNVYLVGTTNSLTGISSEGFQNNIAGNKDAFLVKFDRNGNRLWATYYGGPSNDTGLALELDNIGNIYLGGRTSSSAGIAYNGYQNNHGGNQDAYLVKFDSSGTRIWATYFGNMGTEDGVYSLGIDPFNNIYIAGKANSITGIANGGFQDTIGGGEYDAFLTKFDPTGALLWSTYYGGTGTDAGYSVVTDPYGAVYLAGHSNSTGGIAYNGYLNTSQGGYDNFIVKFSASGNRLWGTYFGGTGNEESYGFQSNYGTGTSDAFVAKFDSNGMRYCVTYYGANGTDRGFAVTSDNAGSIYFSGRTNSPTGISYLGHQNILGGGPSDALLVKFGSCMNVGMEDEASNTEFSVFPNPSSGLFNIELNIQEGEIEVYNSLGELVLQKTINQNSSFDLSNQQRGIYFVRVLEKGVVVGNGKILLID